MESGVRSVPVVAIEPRLEMLAPVSGVGISLGVGPFAQRGLDEALGFAIGARGVGTGEEDAETCVSRRFACEAPKPGAADTAAATREG